VLTGRAGAVLSRKRIRLVSRLSGTCLIGGGIWLALTRGR
jgi:homoserine/homoserine lactone efflux protein